VSTHTSVPPARRVHARIEFFRTLARFTPAIQDRRSLCGQPPDERCRMIESLSAADRRLWAGHHGPYLGCRGTRAMAWSVRWRLEFCWVQLWADYAIGVWEERGSAVHHLTDDAALDLVLDPAVLLDHELDSNGDSRALHDRLEQGLLRLDGIRGPDQGGTLDSAIATLRVAWAHAERELQELGLAGNLLDRQRDIEWFVRSHTLNHDAAAIHPRRHPDQQDSSAVYKAVARVAALLDFDRKALRRQRQRPAEAPQCDTGFPDLPCRYPECTSYDSYCSYAVWQHELARERRTYQRRLRRDPAFREEMTRRRAAAEAIALAAARAGADFPAS
jgi:hypothetical protein